jgi:hypothetical protein
MSAGGSVLGTCALSWCKTYRFQTVSFPVRPVLSTQFCSSTFGGRSGSGKRLFACGGHGAGSSLFGTSRNHSCKQLDLNQLAVD